MVEIKGQPSHSYEEFFAVEGPTWWKATDESGQITRWYVRPPCGHTNLLVGPDQPVGGKFHVVEEHEDGTITVDPSLWCHAAGDCWHGFIRGGNFIEYGEQ